MVTWVTGSASSIAEIVFAQGIYWNAFIVVAKVVSVRAVCTYVTLVLDAVGISLGSVSRSSS